eukprot:gene9639-biopygen9277
MCLLTGFRRPGVNNRSAVCAPRHWSESKIARCIHPRHSDVVCTPLPSHPKEQLCSTARAIICPLRGWELRAGGTPSHTPAGPFQGWCVMAGIAGQPARGPPIPA